MVSGKPLRRPTWFFDPSQQGDALVDVNTHLVDLTHWMLFDTTVLDYTRDIQLNKAVKWKTPLSLSQFSTITGADAFPDFLLPYVKDTIAGISANGTVDYIVKGIHVRLSALWNFEAPKGGEIRITPSRGVAAVTLSSARSRGILETGAVCGACWNQHRFWCSIRSIC